MITKLKLRPSRLSYKSFWSPASLFLCAGCRKRVSIKTPKNVQGFNVLLTPDVKTIPSFYDSLFMTYLTLYTTYTHFDTSRTDSF